MKLGDSQSSAVKLIDFDAASRIGDMRLMSKISTAFASPELFEVSPADGSVSLRSEESVPAD